MWCHVTVTVNIHFPNISIESQCFTLTFASVCDHGSVRKLQSDWTHPMQWAGTTRYIALYEALSLPAGVWGWLRETKYIVHKDNEVHATRRFSFVWGKLVKTHSWGMHAPTKISSELSISVAFHSFVCMSRCLCWLHQTASFSRACWSVLTLQINTSW